MWVVTVVGALAGAVLTSVALTPPEVFAGDEIAGVVLAAVYGTLALVITQRLPTNRIGWLLAVVGFFAALHALLSGYATAAYLGPTPLPGGLVALWATEWAPLPADFAIFLFLPLLFPTGRLPSARWRPVLWAAVGGSGLFMVGEALVEGPLETHVRIAQQYGAGIDNPVGIVPSGTILFRPGEFDDVLDPFLFAVLIAVWSAALIRFRRSQGEERQQFKWFGYSLVPLAAFAVLLESVVAPLAFLAVAPLPAVALVIAILRYRLYDIDRVISRTLSYALLTALLGGVYAGLVLLLGVALRPFTGGSDLAVAGSVLVVAALFQPLRRRVQAAVDRRFNRARYDAEQAIDAFAVRLRQEVDLDRLTGELTRVVGTTMHPARVSVWLREGETRP